MRTLTIAHRTVASLIAGQGGRGEIRRLRALESAWRRGLFWLLMTTLRDSGPPPGPLLAPADLIDLLERVRRTSPAEVGAILTHPHAGIWAMHTLRVLRGTATDSRPPWALPGYLHALVAVAAHRAGLDFRMALEVTDGTVTLPGLGYATVPAPAPRTVEATGTGGELTLTAGTARITLTGAGTATTAGAAAWFPLRTLTAGDLTVVLDDSDPYRSLRAPRPPQRLADHDVDHWQRHLSGAHALLTELLPDRVGGLAAGLHTIIALPTAERFRPLSASADDAFGAVQISRPRSAAELAVALVHEFQHNKLGALMHALDMFEGTPTALFYAPWRDDPRPLRGVLQGVYAFIGIVEFWQAYRHRATGTDGDLARFEFALWHHQVGRTLDILGHAGDITLTEHGAGLIGSLSAGVRRRHPGDDRITTLARAAADDHHAQWRAWHVRPRTDHVDRFTKAWLGGQPRPPLPADGDGTITDDTAGRWLDTRAVLTRMWLSDPDGLTALLGDPAALRTACAGATVTDAHLARGDLDAAETGYLTRLGERPDDPWAWTGLRMVRAAHRPAGPGDTLHHRPELVRAVQAACTRQGRPAGPRELADWFSG